MLVHVINYFPNIIIIIKNKKNVNHFGMGIVRARIQIFFQLLKIVNYNAKKVANDIRNNILIPQVKEKLFILARRIIVPLIANEIINILDISTKRNSLI